MRLEDIAVNATVIVKAAPWHGQRFRVIQVRYTAVPPVVILGLEDDLRRQYAFDPAFVCDPAHPWTRGPTDTSTGLPLVLYGPNDLTARVYRYARTSSDLLIDFEHEHPACARAAALRCAADALDVIAEAATPPALAVSADAQHERVTLFAHGTREAIDFVERYFGVSTGA